MAHSVGIGFSQNPDAVLAAREAAEMAKKQFNYKQIDIAFFFHTVHYNPKDLSATFYDELEKTQVIGSSTAGIILPDKMEPYGVAVMIIGSDYIRFQSSSASHLKLQNLNAVGKTLAKEASLNLPPSQRKLFLLITDGLIQNISSLISGTKDFFGPAFHVLGAGSCDNFHFRETHQSYNNKAFSNGAAGVILAGKFKYGISCRHGCRPLGKPRKITDTEGNIIKKINDNNAFNIFREYFENDADQIKKGILGYINLRYPLGLYTATKHEYLLRNVIDVLDDESIVCQDSVRKENDIHIMSGSIDSYLLAAVEAAKDVKNQLEGASPGFILIFESLTRLKLLGKAIDQEIRLIRDVLGWGTPMLGMYSFGEIFTSYMTENFGQTHLQNGSVLILAIS